MTINQILEEICKKNSIYDEILCNILGKQNQIVHKNELISEIAINYLTNAEKIESVYEQGYFKYFFIMTVKNQVIGGPFFRNCIQTISSKRIKSESLHNQLNDIQDDCTDEIDYKIQMDEQYHLVNAARKEIKMTWFESEMMRLYFDENMTYRAIEKEYQLDHVNVFLTIKRVKERIKKHIEQKCI